MSAWDRHWYGDVEALRPYLLRKGVLFVLAFDTWLLMVRHAGRYGAGGFNMAHFEWLDRLQPLPSAGWYLGTVMLAGLLALAMVFAGESRAGMAAVFGLYTYSWSMSLLDAYQHHYLLSLILFCLIFMPPLSAERVLSVPDPPTAKGRAKGKARRKRELGQTFALSAWAYTGLVWLLGLGLLFVDVPRPRWAWRAAALALVVVAAWVVAPKLRAARTYRTSAWGYQLFLTLAGIVYAYTGVAKMDDTWRSGTTFRVIGDADQFFQPLARYAERLGVGAEAFWEFAGTAVVAGELWLGVGYTLMVYRDQVQARWVQVVAWLTWFAAMGLHLTIENIGLSIGWFSYYMTWVACVCLLPISWLIVLATAVTWPARQLALLFARWEGDAAAREESPLTPVVLSVAVAALCGFAGHSIDLPGAMTATLCLGAGLVSFSLHAVRYREQASSVRRHLAGGGAALGILWLALTHSEVRYDYYRYRGGDLVRRHLPAEALEAYESAQRYAPKGKSRQNKIDRLRRQLGR